MKATIGMTEPCQTRDEEFQLHMADMSHVTWRIWAE